MASKKPTRSVRVTGEAPSSTKAAGASPKARAHPYAQRDAAYEGPVLPCFPNWPKPGQWGDGQPEPGYVRVSKVIGGQTKLHPNYRGEPLVLDFETIKNRWGNGTYILELMSARDDANPNVVKLMTHKLALDEGDDYEGIPWPEGNPDPDEGAPDRLDLGGDDEGEGDEFADDEPPRAAGPQRPAFAPRPQSSGLAFGGGMAQQPRRPMNTSPQGDPALEMANSYGPMYGLIALGMPLVKSYFDDAAARRREEAAERRAEEDRRMALFQQMAGGGGRGGMDVSTATLLADLKAEIAGLKASKAQGGTLGDLERLAGFIGKLQPQESESAGPWGEVLKHLGPMLPTLLPALMGNPGLAAQLPPGVMQALQAAAGGQPPYQQG